MLHQGRKGFQVPHGNSEYFRDIWIKHEAKYCQNSGIEEETVAAISKGSVNNYQLVICCYIFITRFGAEIRPQSQSEFPLNIPKIALKFSQFQISLKKFVRL